MALVVAVKVGSTTVSILAAESLDRPEWRRAEVLRLWSRPVPEGSAALTQTLAAWAERLRPKTVTRVLVGGGAWLRHHPDALAGHPWAKALWVLDPQEEASLTWAAVQARYREPVAVLDIGGGSTELGCAEAVWSWPVGVEQESPAPVDWPPLGGRQLVVVGGLASALAPVWHASADPPQTRWAALLARDAATWLAQGVDPTRVPLLPRGLTLLGSALERWGWPTLGFSTRGLLEGLWLAAALGRGWEP
ncbi:MAG: hypothetical protein K6U14_04480 [Firmicutes bacterium]|nr:hypothetical protein [Alicyclobacillaceae bacterium]MCL6496878.1 hypothetical protein [Bacillota bacterium]